MDKKYCVPCCRKTPCGSLDDRETEIKMGSKEIKIMCEFEVKLGPEDVGFDESEEMEEPEYVKKEQEYLKAEVEWGNSVSEADSDALAELYPGHVVKDELVLGPEGVQPPGVILTLRAAQTSEMTEQPVSHTSLNVEQEASRRGDAGNVTVGVAGNESERDNTHDRTLTGEKRYFCQICKKMFKRLCHLKAHELIHTGKKLYSCGTCQQAFTQSGVLRIHERIHTGERPYTCEICEQKFRRSDHLKRHKGTHTGEKPYTCSLCKRTFTQSSTLKTHERIHTGERPHSCDVCDKKFTQLSDLKRHERIHTGEKRYSCGICKRNFSMLGNLQKHERNHARETPRYPCSV